MKQNYLAITAIIILTAILGVWILVTPEQHSGDGHGDHGGGHGNAHDEETEKGKHGGRLLKQGDFALELVIFERGTPPEFRVYSYAHGKALNPNEIKLTIKLHRTGNIIDTINFQVQQDYLQGDAVVYEPHSFAVEIEANYKEKHYQWRYENFEGRTNIPADMASAMDWSGQLKRSAHAIRAGTY